MSQGANGSEPVHGRNLIKVLKAIDTLSRPQGASIKELQEELGVSRRSVYRMFETLNELQFPIYDDDIPGEKEKRWHLEENYLHNLPNLRIPDMKLTPREMLLLYFLLSQDHVLSNTTVGNLLSSIRYKLSMLMPSKYLTAAKSDRLNSIFITGSSHPKDYSGYEQAIDVMLEAIVEQQVCRITYTALSHGETKSYLVHPLRMFERDGGLYLLINLPSHDVIRILAVDRVNEVELIEEHFSEPAGFDPEEVLLDAFDLTLDDPIAIEVRFSEQAARRVLNRRWSSSQKVTRQNDGSIILKMHTSGKDDLFRWILGFGDQAEILKPDELRDEINRLLNSTIQQYK
jgi:predicted DNA-binding transcriptional regulator YafY